MASPKQRVKEHTSTMRTYDKICLQFSIIQEDNLRRTLADNEQLRATSPERWRERESERLASNREREVVNRRLRDLGLPLARLEPSLAEQRRELQRLQAHNAAEIARLQKERAEKGRTRRGTSLASVRRRP